MQRAAELPSPFALSLQQKGEIKKCPDEETRQREANEEKRRRTLAILARIASQKEQLEQMSGAQVLNRRTKQAQKANKEWKWEFRRQ